MRCDKRRLRIVKKKFPLVEKGNFRSELFVESSGKVSFISRDRESLRGWEQQFRQGISKHG